MNDKIERLRKERDDLEREVETTVAALNEKNTSVGLENELDEMKRKKVGTAGEMVSLHVQLTTSEKHMREMKENWEKEKATVIELRERLDTATKTVSSLEIQLELQVAQSKEDREKMEAVLKKEVDHESRLKKAEEIMLEQQTELEETKKLKNQLQDCLKNGRQQESRYQVKFGELRDAVVSVSEEVTGFMARRKDGEENEENASQRSTTLVYFLNAKFKELGEIEAALAELVGLDEAKKMVMHSCQLIDPPPTLIESPTSWMSPPTLVGLTPIPDTELDGCRFSIPLDTETTTDMSNEGTCNPPIATGNGILEASPASLCASGNALDAIHIVDVYSAPQREDEESSGLNTNEATPSSEGSPRKRRRTVPAKFREVKMKSCITSFPSPDNNIPIPHHAVDCSKPGQYCLCGFHGRSETNLKAHIRYHTQTTGTEKKFTCPISSCNRRFGEMELLRLHVSKIHKIAYNRKGCELCGDTFKNQEKLEEHQRSGCEKQGQQETQRLLA